MADRTSAGIFGELLCAAEEQGHVTAVDLWEMAKCYDFHPCQMGCDEVLENLGLLRQCDNKECPEYDEEEHGGGIYVYGPTGTECDECFEVPECDSPGKRLAPEAE